ncbi:MAG: leucine-rich repeat protein, partial [Clostridia bacterium]|nr:leucine-rich repeat protein [Clostridia bacterium]
MSQNICNICGANYEYRNGRWVCPACGAYKAEELSNEEVTLLYNAAQKLRLSDFDEAEKAYADIIVKYPQNSEGYWGRLLSRFGIKYEEDFDGKQIPTCYATIESIISDKDYVKAISLADEDTKEYYVKQAEYIERVRKEWVEKARKEKSYDIFISYKDSDTQNGIERTKDSIAAQDLYIHLTRKGYRVFFSRESLRDKVGEKFEPYIFGALSTAKVMLVYGSSSEYITSTWVKNEWMRFEKRVQAGEKKKNSLIVACDGCSPAELPKVLSSMQCLDATKRSFYEDLDNAIDKIIKVEEKPKEQVTEKKKVKKLPIVLGAVAALIAILCCIIIPNVTNQEITSLTNSYYGITVEADRDVFPKGTELKIEEVLSGEKYDMVKNAIGEKSESFKIYDIELEGKKTVDINGTVTVKIPLPNNMSTTGISAYYISDKGVAENLDCSVADGYVTFKTTHFSLYVIAEDKVNNTGFDYKINSDDTVTLNKYTGNETEVVIPQTIEGKTVVEIGSLAFDSLDRITSVVIPETVTTIGAKAFYGCTSIKSITIPSTVTSIGTSAFYGWNNSQEIILAGCKDIPTGWNAQWNGSCNAKLVYGLITIIFHANGGSGTMSNQMIEINSSALVNENKFTLAGYTFSGWATTENGEVAILDKGSYTVEKESV